MKLMQRKIETIGIIGSGQIGPDIALHFAMQGVEVIVVDVSREALKNGRAKFEKKIDKLESKKKLKPEKAEAIKSKATFTDSYGSLAKAQWVIEAATEDIALKRSIFEQLEYVCNSETVFTSNSSHLEPDQVFGKLSKQGRAAITHFFYPADRNPVVEIVAGSKTEPQLVTDLNVLFESTGKLALEVKSQYGYAIDPVFEGLCLAACHAVDKGIGTIKEVDAVAQNALKMTVGPFTAMNLVGGRPIIAKGIDNYSKFIPWFRQSKLLNAQIEKNEDWDIAAKDEEVKVDKETEEALSNYLLGAYFMLAGEVLEAEIINISDFEDGLALALDMAPAISLMNKIGIKETLKIVGNYVAEDGSHGRIPPILQKQVARGQWRLQHVQRKNFEDIAVLTLRRFKVLNALSSEVLFELESHIDEIAADNSVRGVVIRGYGTRAFVAGADIKELAQLKTSEDAANLARQGQKVFSKIESLKKPVIAAMNGLAFGGGNELAMSCHLRLAAEKQKVFVGQPEPKLGVIPGYGGTQRLPRWIGMEKAWPILRTGNPISSADALEYGLIKEEIAFDELLMRAVSMARDIADGDFKPEKIPSKPISVPASFEDVDIGGLSTAIDEILQNAVIEGARGSLDDGLEIEALAFGACVATKDFKIGMKNFIENGPKAAAKFKHQ